MPMHMHMHRLDAGADWRVLAPLEMADAHARFSHALLTAPNFQCTFASSAMLL